MKKAPFIAVAVASLAVSAAAAPGGFGMIGLTPGQTLRLNAANPDLPPGRGQLPPGPCRVELSFVDGSDQLLLPAVQIALPAGQSTHYDLNGDQLFPPPANLPTTVDLPAVQRMEVRPVIVILPNTRAGGATDAFPPGPCVSSIEIIDHATGKALINSGPQNPGDIVGFNPQPDPPGDIFGFNPQPDPPGFAFGQMAVVTGQTIRLNAVSVLDPRSALFPPGPCRVTLVLFGPDGAVLANTVQTLNPGQAAMLDFSMTAPVVNVAATAALSGEVRGLVTVQNIGPGPHAADPCRATLEVFDNATGRTTALQSPQHVQGL